LAVFGLITLPIIKRERDSAKGILHHNIVC